MQDLRDVIEGLVPLSDERGDWDAVVRDARGRRPVLLGSVAGIAVAASVLFGLVLFQPWSTERRTFLERALAAVDGGPVIHAVLRGDWGGTNVDLTTGARTPDHGETEIWHHPESGRIRVAARLGETVIHQSVYEEERASPEQTMLGRDYKAALESGTARTAGEDVIDGEPVTWVVVKAEVVPHGDGKMREWTQQVAVSNETYKPVATQDFVDGGAAGKGSLSRVLLLETLPADDVDLELPPEGVQNGALYSGSAPISIGMDRAAEVLGTKPLWLGAEHAGLLLSQLTETSVREGKQSERELTGSAAEDAKVCAQAAKRSERLGPCLRRSHGLTIRGDKVYEHGPVAWGEEERGVSFFYGTLGDDPKTYRKDRVPLLSEPFVKVSETTKEPSRVVGGNYFPAEGTVFIGAGDRQGNLRQEGLYVLIEASSPALILSAARALEPVD
jgi:hypothetical protein